MRKVVDTGLFKVNAPLELAAISNGTLYVCTIPTRADGTVETGGFSAQVELTLLNLKQAVEAAGATMDDVVQVQVFLTSGKYLAAMNAVYAKFFREPYPVRATLITGLIVPGADIEILAHADVSHVVR
jgi:enamine deaminase RidA (YjgF/YER057c/UK114 family)